MSFSEPRTITPEERQIPDMDLVQETFIRTADMNANGTIDIVWNRQTGFIEVGAPNANWVYLDLTAGIRPNLLNRIKNGIGRIISIDYKSSTDYVINDRNENGKDWTDQVFHNPFPVQVVSKYSIYDGISDSMYTTEIKYHDPYYDGPEKQFRGFRKVDKIESGSESEGIPTLVTTFQFHVGDVIEALKGKPISVETKTEDGKIIFYRDINQWETKLFNFDYPTEEKRRVVYPYLTSNVRQVIEGGKIENAVQLMKLYCLGSA